MTGKPNCRPGDIAIVVRAEQSINLGAIVEVLRLCDRSGDLRYPDEKLVWIVRCSRYMKWVYRGKNYYRREGPALDAVLRPIRGERLNLTATTTAPEPVIADVSEFAEG